VFIPIYQADAGRLQEEMIGDQSLDARSFALTAPRIISISSLIMPNHTNMNMHIPFRSADLPLLYGSVKVGERGQVVIPHDARTEMGLRPGDKLLALGGIPGMQGIVLIKAESFSTLIAEISAKMGTLERLLRMADAEAKSGGEEAGGRKPPRKTKRSRA
jgi:AbrB family looped-hinge helix DNA binding protein